MFQMAQASRAVEEQVALLGSPLPDRPLEEWADVVADTQILINRLTAIQTVALAKVAATEEVVIEDGTVAQETRSPGYVRLDAPGLVSDLLGVTDQAASVGWRSPHGSAPGCRRWSARWGRGGSTVTERRSSLRSWRRHRCPPVEP